MKACGETLDICGKHLVCDTLDICGKHLVCDTLDICGKHLVCDKERAHLGDHSQTGETFPWRNTGYVGETPEEKHRRSLDYAIADAKKTANESGENCYILHSEIYANSYHEYDNVEHVAGTRAAFATLFSRWQRPEYKSKIVGVVSPDGEVFLNELGDIFATLPKTIRINRGDIDALAHKIKADESQRPFLSHYRRNTRRH